MRMLNTPEKPYSREEEYLANIAGEGTPVPEKAYSRKEAYLDAISGHVSGMASDISDLNQKVAALATDFSYKGSVPTYADLPANPAVGDVYTTEDEGYMYVWDGNSWQILNMQGGGGGPTVVQTTGTSTTDVMSQDATTKMIYQDPANAATSSPIVLRGGSTNTISSYSVNIGGTISSTSARAFCFDGKINNASRGIAIGQGAEIGGSGIGSCAGAIALGAKSHATHRGEINVGSTDTGYGYDDTNYRLISGVHDPQSAHDAATKGYVDANAGPAIIYTDTTKYVNAGQITFYEDAALTTPYSVSEIHTLLSSGKNIKIVRKAATESSDTALRYAYDVVASDFPKVCTDETMDEAGMHLEVHYSAAGSFKVIQFTTNDLATATTDAFMVSMN